MDLKADRARLGVTQAQAAKVVSITQRQWRRWENGEQAMPPYMVELWKLKTARRGRR